MSDVKWTLPFRIERVKTGVVNAYANYTVTLKFMSLPIWRWSEIRINDETRHLW